MSKKKKSKNKDPFAGLLQANQLIKKIKDAASDPVLKDGIKHLSTMQSQILKGEEFNNLKNQADILTKVSLTNKDSMNPYKEVTLPQLADDGFIVNANKNLVVAYLNDYYGCGHYRILYPFSSMNSLMGGKVLYTTMSKMITQEDILATTQAFWFQRPTNEGFYTSIATYKKYQKYYQYKLIIDLDDYLFEIPEYNNSNTDITVHQLNILLECIKLVDTLVVSTENLKKEMIDVGVPSEKIVVVENTIPKSLYGTDTIRHRFTNLGTKSKPSILYNGTSSHYSKVDDGDLGGVFKEFILKYNDKYDFKIMGSGPEYMTKLIDEGKVKLIPYYPLNLYPFALRNNRVDFILAPLKENIFNTCKSDLKYLESSAIGSVFIGSSFENNNSPYENAILKYKESDGVEYLNDLIQKHLDKDLYNNVIEDQYEFLKSRWTENLSNTENYIKLCTSGIERLNSKQ